MIDRCRVIKRISRIPQISYLDSFVLANSLTSLTRFNQFYWLFMRFDAFGSGSSSVGK